MAVLVDTDVLLKLGACDLLPSLLELTGVGQEQIHLLPSTPYVLERPSLKENYTSNGVERAREFARGTHLLQDEIVHEETYDRLLGVEDIHAGEALLLAKALEHKNCLVVTGDKRSIRALASTQRFRHVCVHLEGSLVCLEQLILRVVEVANFQKVCKKIYSARGCDTVLRIAFSTQEPDRVTVNTALNSYVKDLRNDAGSLLIPEEQSLPDVLTTP